MTNRVPALLLAVAGVAAPAAAHPSRNVLVDVAVQVDGRRETLHPARDGSGRLYLRARPGGEYEIRLENRTPERVGAVVLVDGLNVIDAAREEPASGRPGRMYVLDPWGSTTIRGWRSSLEDVHAFTFEDEAASYAARMGRANRKMGWIEVAVHRERHRPRPEPQVSRRGRDQAGAAGKAEGDAQEAPAPSVGGAERSYPGTGWGDRIDDGARLVQFEAEAHPAQVTTIRYEYEDALRALGILPRHHRDRLRERDGAFAPPPPGY